MYVVHKLEYVVSYRTFIFVSNKLREPIDPV